MQPLTVWCGSMLCRNASAMTWLGIKFWSCAWMKPNITSILVMQDQIDTGITTPVGIHRSLNLLRCDVHNARTNKFVAMCMEGYILFPMRPLVLYPYAL